MSAEPKKLSRWARMTPEQRASKKARLNTWRREKWARMSKDQRLLHGRKNRAPITDERRAKKRASQRIWRQNNPEKVREYNKRVDPVKARERVDRYRSNHPDRVRSSARKSNAKRRRLFPEIIKEAQRRSWQKRRAGALAVMRAYSKGQAAALTDKYVTDQLVKRSGLRRTEVKDLIPIKRAHLKLTRRLRELQQTTTTPQ